MNQICEEKRQTAGPCQFSRDGTARGYFWIKGWLCVNVYELLLSSRIINNYVSQNAL